MAKDILISRDGAAGRIVLNRPQVLNALTHEMTVELHAQLKAWAIDDLVKLVIIEGAGEKAFCAGGDIRALYHSRPANEDFVRQFFADEYRLNMTIKSYPKPYVAIMDGIVMGGGVGVSVPGRRRIATERTICAMPETGIGLFPDVGGTYFLSRAPEYAGIYLGLTGERMNAANAIHAGFADCMVPSADLPGLLAALCEYDYGADVLAGIDQLIGADEIDPGPASLASLAEDQSEIFSRKSMEQIIAGLTELNSEWSNRTIATLNQKSPTSLKVTLQAMNSARALNFNACMAQEYRIVLQIMKGGDIYEGIRALLVDKDGQPRWQPNSLEQVTHQSIDAHFQHLGELELTAF